MRNPSSSLVHLSILIITLFVAEIHGNKQSRALNKLRNSKYSTNSQIDTSHFKVHENIVLDEMVHSQDGIKEKDKIEKLPGQPNVKFSQYGGYVTVDKLAGRAFYYYFVEAYHSKETLPLLLWLNGGINSTSIIRFNVSNYSIQNMLQVWQVFETLRTTIIIILNFSNIKGCNIN